jgi:hypothetical protein
VGRRTSGVPPATAYEKRKRYVCTKLEDRIAAENLKRISENTD